MISFHNFKRIAAVATLMVGMSNGTFAQSGKHEWKEASSAGYKYRYVTNDPTNARFYTLPNGMSVILSVDKTQPRIQSYIAIKAGSKTDPSTHTGLAHYLEHLLFKGTDKFGTLDYNKEKPYLDEISHLYEKYNKEKNEAKRKEIYAQIDSVSVIASKFAIANEYDKMIKNMGAEGSNAFTSFEQTVYLEDVPSSAIDKYLALQGERFRKPVLRLFHTELEAVYEEKNISLDNDGRKGFELFFSLMFPNHNYGQQTTIGTIEHLKNPSLIEIQKYFDNYYVPNNMGVIMAGDFDPDELIKKIDQTFSYMKAKKVQPYTFQPEKPITQPITGEVFGPNPESIMIGYRFPGASDKDARILNLLGQVLTNGSAGIFDLNLVQQQKLLSAYAFPYALKDYSMLILQGNPSEGQSLDDVKKLMLAEIENLKSGKFSDDLMPAIVNNSRKYIIENYENYSTRASALMDNFTTDLDWKNEVGVLEEMQTITKADIIAFANKYLNNNYVAVYKRQGEDGTKSKVEKPTITPIQINGVDQSAFLKSVNAMPENEVKPLWLDFLKDIQKTKTGKYEVLSVQNKSNDLFNLYYYYQIGKWDSKILPIAADFVNFIGTDKKSAENISKEFYSLASTFSIGVSDQWSYVTISGLNNNLDKTIQLFDDLLANAAANPEIWDAYKTRLVKSRTNAKENKGAIMQGLVNYAKFGADNPFNNNLTDEELNNLTVAQVVAELKNLLKYDHRILYYGPSTASDIATTVNKYHYAPASFMPFPAKKVYTEIPTEKTKVLFSNFKMVQADITWTRVGSTYTDEIATTNALFNEYFGGGMGSIVFQTIRESKALAYSSYAYVGSPRQKEKPLSIVAFVGTQSDKTADATAAMNELLNDLPQSEKNFANAKSGLIKSISAERITKDNILFNYLSAERFGRNFDIRKTIYENAQKTTLNDMTNYHAKELSNKPFIYCVVADENSLKKETLEKLGPVQVLDLKTLFGY